MAAEAPSSSSSAPADSARIAGGCSSCTGGLRNFCSRLLQRGTVVEAAADVQLVGSPQGSGALRFVLALDVNGTIIEGDSIKGLAVERRLTQPTLELLEAVREQPVKVVFFTFGNDHPLAVELAREYRPAPVAHQFFIARGKDDGRDDFWAFPLPKSRCDADPGSTCVDWAQKNPSIKQERVDLAMALRARAASEGEVEDRHFRKADAYCFWGAAAFQKFVDCLLEDGDLVFRAAYDPANERFCGRTCIPCKAMAASVPILVYDDNTQDWALFSVGHVVRVVTPGNAKDGRVATDFLAELDRFRTAYLHDEREAPTATGTD